MKKPTVLLALLIPFLLAGCTKQKDYISYHPFPNRAWYRYDIVKFAIPIKETEKSYDILFFARHTPDYPFDNLNFNMVMTTPAGEERINEYPFTLKRNGGFIGKCSSDSCEAEVSLKTDIHFEKTGILVIEIENLVPRLQTPGLLGIGIRMRLHS